MPTSTFQEQGTVTPVASVHVDYVAITSIRRTSLPVAQAAHVYWTVDRVTVCNELESAVSELLRLELRLIVFHNDVEKDIGNLRRCLLLLVLRQVSGVKMRSVEFKDSLSPSATCNTESKEGGILVHAQKTSPVQKRLLVRGELDIYCHWHWPRRRRETAD